MGVPSRLQILHGFFCQWFAAIVLLFFFNVFILFVNYKVRILLCRTLLIREALLLLNRLVSNAAYSITALRVLTTSRDMASLTIDIANRLSRKDQRHGQSDSMTRQMRESEIVSLARVFKKRVYTYLGNSIP